MSPVKCKFMSSLGIIVDFPPPTAPPFKPNTGPREGSRKASTLLPPRYLIASASPIDMVVFPSPALVGFIALTSISLPFCEDGFLLILAIYLP